MIPLSTLTYSQKSKLLLIITIASAFIIVLTAANNNTYSDPRATLLLSESLINRGTIKLDYYGSEFLQGYGDAIWSTNGHYYYYFPIGTSLFCAPFVAIANMAGLEMTEHENLIQIYIASFTTICTLLITYLMARIYLGAYSAVFASAALWYGSSLSSTAGTALWSHNFASLFALWAIFLSVKAAKNQAAQPWLALALLLFAAYLCRPTMSILAPLLLLFVFTYSRAAALKACLLLAIQLGIFVVFSFCELGQYLPDYYQPKRLSGGTFSQAVFGNLLSPSRGLFIFSPFIAVAWLCVLYSYKSWGLNSSWILIGIVWPVLHLLLISRFPHWWAGHSFGPRLMTDVLPGLFLSMLYTWPTHFKPLPARLLCGLLIVAGVFSALVNVGQGLFNRHTAQWNVDPDIDRHPEYIFDWKYPQFMANKQGHNHRLIRHAIYLLEPISRGKVIDHFSGALFYRGWSGAEPTHRWSESKYCDVYFNLDTNLEYDGVIKLRIGSHGPQYVVISLNGSVIYAGQIDVWDDFIDIDHDRSLLKNGTNKLVFELPDACPPDNGDQRILGLALMSFQIK
jgi:hypothetical protein